jgi:4-hydroxy-4-methyl-2-oxoglutarate aldolase
VLVRTGDQIIADRDGAVVVPADAWPAVRADAAALAGREEEVRRRLAAGERLADIQGLDLSPYLPG